MAEEVPISEVLCNAMEYLCKLGSNLRTRSENLKERRISKEKLKNVHAVRKASSKVLLICELSRKSLENVENSVKRVLTLVDASRYSPATVGAKNQNDSSKNFYIEYDSCRLRISEKIFLKHYTSVKVHAKKMPTTMLDKYPVYYNCRLYRKRKQKLYHKSRGETSSKSDEKVKEQEGDTKKNSEDGAKSEESGNDFEEKGIESKAKDEQSQSISSDKDKDEKGDGVSSGESDSDKVKSKMDKRENITKTKKRHDSDSKSGDSDSAKNKKNLKVEKIFNKKNETDTVSDSEAAFSKSEITVKKPKPETEHIDVSKKIKKMCKITNKPKRIGEALKKSEESDSNVSSEQLPESETQKSKSSFEPSNRNDRLSEESKSSTSTTKETSKKNQQSKKSKSIRFPDSDSDSSEKRSKHVSGNENKRRKLDKENQNKCDNTNEPEVVELLDDSPRKPQDSKGSDKKDTKSNEDSNSNTEKKPMIKLVSLTKLLKPDVLQKEICNVDEKNKNTKKTSVKKSNGNSKETNKNSYQEKMRREVSAFKPKKFDVVVTRLPKFSDIFLCKYGLKRITQNGSEVFRLACEVSITEKEKNSLSKSKTKEKKTSERLDLTDDTDRKIDEVIGKAKHSLLNSDSDDVDTNKEDLKKDKNLKEQNSEEADNKSNDQNKIKIGKTKCSLLNSDSDDINTNKEELKKDKNSKKQDSEEDDSKVNDQNKIKIGKAKRLLLNSDSDDVNTDKEELKKDKNSKKQDSEEADNKENDQNKIKNQPEGPDENRIEIENCEEKLASNSDIAEIVSLDSLEGPKTPENKKIETEETTPRSRRKQIMESMHAKKMLLTYSSSSDTDDEELRNTMKDIKSALLKNSSSSSEDEIDVKKIVQLNRKKLIASSDSDEGLKIARKSKRGKVVDSEEKDESSISQMDGTNDELSNSSSQMGRSKTKVASRHRKQSSENVDANESEINRLTNLKTITTRSRRRRSVDNQAAKSTRRMPKAPPIKDEILAPTSSGSGSESEHEAAEMDELPPVPMQGLNGDSLNVDLHIAKEDLLATSDPSSSENDKTNASEDEKKDEESDEDTVKSIRRKANAIASDSEGEATRRKTHKISDFEDSEEESSEPRKTKRKKAVSDSDCSLSSTDGGKKKRRRIKQVNDSDGSGSDTENEGKNKHGRKNIRKVMSKDQLEEATKKAARQEKERIARIAERQKLYNNLEFDESGKPDEVVLDKVVLDFNPETKEPIIEVDRGLVKKLKPHQANGIKFMWNACFESVKRIKKDRGSGCILAHCMGLGKTLQVVSLTHTLLTHSSLTGVQRVLVVCPLSTVLNWVNEFTMWLKHAETDRDVDVFELSRHKQNSERSWQLQQWVECGGVCVLGYEMFRNLSADNNKKFKKKMLKTFQEALVDPGPDLVVCDEGHLLKNEKTSLSQSMNRVRTMRRIVLTGTPLQNNLKEYYCMVQFVKPNLLGKYNEYLNRFVNPITNGQYTDSTERDISVMKRRSHVLHTMLDGAVQRRDYGVLAPFLPPKHEYVLFITLTDIQVKLYQHYLDNYSRRPLPGKSSGFLFPDFQSLQRIWTHPLVLKYNSERYEIMQQKKRDKEEEDSEGSLADFIDDDSTPDESSTEESSDDLSDVSDDSRKKSKKKAKAKKGKGKDVKGTGRRGTRANPVEMEEDKPLPDIEEVKYENPTEWWMKLVTDEELEDIRHSHKLLLLFDILRQCEAIGDKLLVFSQSLYSLDLIEHFLGKVDEATQEGRIDEKLAGHVGSWSPGVDYFRLDGSTSCENRSIWCKNFNREDNPRARLFLISTRAGGLGINLVAANRVVIFDVSWNPSHDVQSIFRVYRFGQKKPCYIYRFLAMGTMEEKIYERQVTKQAISKRVIDEQQIDRHYAANDLAELYKFEPVPVEPRPVPSLPKDRLFAEMLKDHEKQIFRFHEHDSLLENKEEETLSEEERKKAWEEFENEKKAPPPTPFPNSWSMHNGMASLLQQQQQQLAYAALAAMIRKDMPNISDNQIRDMLPIICNANPGMFGGYDYGLMQKMSEIYKYAQPGMMNPPMMNPVMNPAAGGMSASSSLQYEPPWQRQQQQQQQMRLQQMMQQQHNMGAKYYAGGLGSRDPVAMALQQQRAREFLGGGGGGGGGGAGAPVRAPGPAAGAGRPRGRPPLQPRAPPATPDVVNLADSD